MKKWSKIIFICIMLLLIYMPILILAVYSFTTSANIGSIHGWSLHNYVTLFTKDELRSMIVGTVFLAAGSALIATILGTLGAIGAFYSKKWASASINAMNEVPVVNADVVTGFSICILLIVAFDMSKDSYVPLVIGHVVLSAPFVYLSVVPKLKQMDSSLYAVSAASGQAMNEAVTAGLTKSKVNQGYLEGSNVQVVDEMVNMIVAQRAYEMNSKAIQATDEMMSQANNLRR